MCSQNVRDSYHLIDNEQTERQLNTICYDYVQGTFTTKRHRDIVLFSIS